MFAVFGIDRPGTTLRAALIDAHRAYLAAAELPIPSSGPLVADDGETMVGSLIFIDTDSRRAVEAFMADEPMARAGLYQSLEIRRWRQRVGAFESLEK